MMLLIILSMFQNFDSPKYLSNYLESHNHKLDENKAYVIMSQNSCLYCSKYTSDLLSKIDYHTNLVVITGEKDLITNMIKNGSNSFTLIYDKDYDFDNLPYNFEGLTVMTVENGTTKRKVFGLKELDNLHGYLMTFKDE